MTRSQQITSDYRGCVKTLGRIWIWHYLSCLIGGEWKILFVDKINKSLFEFNLCLLSLVPLAQQLYWYKK